MGGVSLLVGTRKQLPTPRLMLVPLSVFCGAHESAWRDSCGWDKMVLEIGSPESHLVNLLGIKKTKQNKKKPAFLCKDPFGTGLGLQGTNEKGLCNWPSCMTTVTASCFPRSVDSHIFS